MGYDVTRFDGEVDEELLCPICGGVLENPVQATQCEHAFCSLCINDWLARQSTCPIDRGNLRKINLRPVPRILRNLLARLKISCEFLEHGCTQFFKLDTLHTHLQECDFNPKKQVTCDKGCGLTMAKDELTGHDCIRDLRNLLLQQQQKIILLEKESNTLKEQQADLKRELNSLQENFQLQRQLMHTNDSIEMDEVRRWVGSLQMCRVTRWGGMISTPDAVLQTVVKRALIECGCPSGIINDLMANSHERKWPAGLKTLEARQNNRRMYENYVCKRIPGKQAVVVMSCDNEHMNEDMMLEPGLIMIFAHGVE